MYDSTRSDVRFRFGARPLAASFAGAALCLACAGEVVDVGENGGGVVGDRCRASTTLGGDVVIASQEQLEEIAGCEVIAGDLTIVQFLGADLSPLYALTRVEGHMGIGAAPVLYPELTGITFEDAATGSPVLAELHSSWLSSLDGLERLEEVDSLGITAPITTLEPLSNLHYIINDRLSVYSETLQDLNGLEQVRGVSELSVETASPCDISALRLPEGMQTLSLGGPITKLDATELVAVGSLGLYGVALENLDTFGNLTQAESIEIVSCPSLENIDGLNGLTWQARLVIEQNPALTHLPSFSSLYGFVDLIVRYNSSLTDMMIVGGEDEWRHFDPREIDISRNPLLRRVAMPGNWDDVGKMTIAWNGLREVDIGGIEIVEQLMIQDNPELESWRAPALHTVTRLAVVRTPLSASNFDSVNISEPYFE